MNRILLLLSFSLLFLTNCKQDEDPVALSIAGTWKPVKMVETIVINGGQPDSNTYVYDDCQQMSRFVFNADLSGKVKKQGYLNQQCMLLSDENMSYVYDSKTGAITLQYTGTKEVGVVSDLTETTMNLKVEILEPNIYKSQTYTLVKSN
jgi:hypothetical protein